MYYLQDLSTDKITYNRDLEYLVRKARALYGHNQNLYEIGEVVENRQGLIDRALRNAGSPKVFRHQPYRPGGYRTH